MASNKKITYCLLFIFMCMSPSLNASDTGLLGYNQQLFRPQTDGYGLYNVSGSSVMPHLKYSLGIYANYNNNALHVVMPARRSNVGLIDRNITGDFVAALGLFNFIDLGVDVPITFYEMGKNYDTLQTYSASSFDDIRADAKIRLLRDTSGSIGLAIMSIITFPTGDRYKFTGNNGVTWEGRLVFDKTIDRFSFYLNSGYRFVKSQTILSTNLDDRITFGGGSSVRLPFNDDKWILLAELYGESMAKDIKEITTPIEVLAGVRREFDSGVAVNLGGGRRLFNAIGATDLRLFAGLSFDMAKRESVKTAKASNNSIKIDYTAYFTFGSFDISQNEFQELNRIGELILNNDNVLIVVEGHTDDIGSSYYNELLGERRAEAVRAYLTSLGVSPERIQTKSFGELAPVAANSSRDGRAKNRRVEIHNTSSSL